MRTTEISTSIPLLRSMFAPLIAVLLLPSWANAVNYCVSNTAALTAALNTASNTSADDEIRIAVGTYTLTSLQSYEVSGDLKLRGGWNAGCTIQSENPADTVITSSTPQSNYLRLEHGSSSVLIERLHFSQMGGLWIRESGAYSTVVGEFRIQRNRFSGNNFGLQVSSGSHDVRIDNNIFLNNDGTSGAGSGRNLRISGSANAGASISLDVVLNTMLGARFGIDFFGGADFRRTPRFQNNIVWNSSDADLLLQGNQAIFAGHNIIGTRSLLSGASISTDFQNLNVDPQLSAVSNIPTINSPAINSGTTSMVGALPTSDYDGSPRLIGIAPDRGAHETSVDNSVSLVVNTDADSGVGSLRQAITSANLNPDFKKITFNIPGSCPHSINLSTALPALTQPVAIEGYTQPGSAPNNEGLSFNGTVCVFLVGSNAIASGLRLQTQTADDVMTVRGLGFYGFNTDALRISGPGKGRVLGNIFGTGLSLFGQNFADAVIRVFDAPGTIIGTTENADMNVIGGGDVVGVDLTASTLGDRSVDGNLIGINRNGSTALSNGIGVRIVGGSFDNVRSNIVSFNTSHGITIDGPGTRNLVFSNRFGASLNSAAASGNGGNAVRIFGGSGHRIRANDILKSAGDGIAVLSTSRANKLQINEFDGNQRQAIDLSPDGVNPIDTDVGQTGANDQQNYPLINDAVGSNTQGEVLVNFSSANGTYDIEVFANPDCIPSVGGFNQAQEFLGAINGVILDCATANANCSKDVRIPVNNQNLAGAPLIGKGITALAIDEEGNTSEISACRLYRVGDNLFKSGFE
jgi:trimeric autotransporter adhesin